MSLKIMTSYFHSNCDSTKHGIKANVNTTAAKLQKKINDNLDILNGFKAGRVQIEVWNGLRWESAGCHTCAATQYTLR